LNRSQKSICFVAPFIYPLLAGNGSGVGGAERQFFLFGREIAKRGWNVSYITDFLSKKNSKNCTLFSVEHSSFTYLGGSNYYILLNWLHLLWVMKKLSADYYVIKTPSHLLAPMAFYCSLAKKKLVFWSQTSSDFKPDQRSSRKIANIFSDWGINKTDIIIAQTKDQLAEILNSYKKNAYHVPSIYDELMHGADGLQEGGCHKDIDVLWVGNSLSLKRYEVVIELAKKMPLVKFVLAMNNADRYRFEQARKLSNDHENLTFLGQVPPPAMTDWFRRSKLLLNTSSREGFPNTFLQAWMRNVPVVSLGIDPDRLLVRKKIGWVVDEKNVQKCGNDFSALAELLVHPIKELLLNEGLRNQIGARGKKYVKENHSPPKTIMKLLCALSNDKK